MDRLRALPGVTAVGVVNNIPLDEGTGRHPRSQPKARAKSVGPLLDMNVTGGDYFRVMGIELLQGRTFTTPRR